MAIKHVSLFLAAIFLLHLQLAAQPEVQQKDSAEWEPTTIFKFLMGQHNKAPRSNEDFYNMDLDSLDGLKADIAPSELEKELNAITEIATYKSMSIRSAPSVVTVINREQIMRMGARDLMDVLRTVPGFHFALDESGRIGLGVRGNWASEGKMLLLVDGQEMNDIYTAKLFFGHHYSPEMIERIEIIRGPGSAIYGGFAEFGVINIITRSVKEKQGLYLSNSYGFTYNMQSRINDNFYWGKSWDKWDVSLATSTGMGQRSNQNQWGFYANKEPEPDTDFNTVNTRDYIGSYQTLNGNSKVTYEFMSLYVRYKDFYFRAVNDPYYVTDVTLMDNDNGRKHLVGLRLGSYELMYKKQFNKLKLMTKLNTVAQYQQINSNLVPDSLDVDYLNSDYIVRPKVGVHLNYDMDHRKSFNAGAEFFWDMYREHAKEIPDENQEYYEYKNVAAYLQSIIRFPVVNLTAGVRYEQNFSFGSSVVPRLGLTKRYNKFHFKALASAGFRAPSVGNYVSSYSGNYTVANDTILNIERAISPEKTTVFELEGGYQFTDNLFLTANIFHIKVKDPIAYYYLQDPVIEYVLNYDEVNSGTPMGVPKNGLYVYQNFKKTGSQGLELDFLFKDTWGNLNVNYSFYRMHRSDILPVNAISQFQVYTDKLEPIRKDKVLAFPKHTFNLQLNFKINEKLSAYISSTVYGSRYGYTEKMDVVMDMPGKTVPDTSVTGTLKRFSPTIISNAYLYYDKLWRGLSIGFGVYDIFNQKFEYLQPYYGVNVPLPSSSTEYMLKVSYDFNKWKDWRRETQGTRVGQWLDKL